MAVSCLVEYVSFLPRIFDLQIEGVTMHNRILRTCWAFLAVALIFVSTAKAQTTSCSIGYSVHRHVGWRL